MDKIDRLLDVMEHPDSYPPTEIEAMLSDGEVKEVFDVLDKTMSGIQPITTPDIDSEWKRFEEKHRDFWKLRKNWHPRLFSRNAVATIAIAIASFTAVAALVGVGIHKAGNNRAEVAPEVSREAEEAEIASYADTLKTVEVVENITPKTVVFEDEPLENILTDIAAYYDCNVVFNQESSKSLRLYFRWNQALTLEKVVERLNNFSRIQLTVKDKTIIAN